MEGFDNQRNSSKGAYLTEKEIKNIINCVLLDYSKSISQSIQDRVINKLSKNAVSFLIGIIVAGFVIFKVLDNNIVITKENIELKAQVEKLQLDVLLYFLVIIYLTITNNLLY